MSSLQEKIESDWKDAFKLRDPKKDVLTLIRTELKNKAISDRSGESHSTTLSDDKALDVITKMAKQRRESAVLFKEGNRPDLEKNELFELAIIESYLPVQISDAEINVVVNNVITQIKAESMQDMGKVMGMVMAKLKGKADGGRVQSAVKNALAQK
ncbi:MAG: GatB/YqeY domain-containing protein [bacterium]|nr:GatB/YqeY domain-containing protein [bacterium]